MKNKPILGLSFVFALIIFLLWAQPGSAQNMQYAPGLYPNLFSTPKLHWKITNVTSEVVEFGFGSGALWKAQAGQPLTFEIQEIADNELSGLFTIGNLTLLANDTRIAGELVFSVWPWFPGLVSHLDWTTVDQDATNAASGYFLNGSLDITTTSTTKTYVYHQGPFGNQNTTLVYDLFSGVLLSAFTEVFLLSDYHLGIEFITQTQNPTNLTTLLFVSILAIAIIVVSVSYTIMKFRKKKD